ncbi:hypothetical protein [Streptomyces lateritius]|uniref:hypothetical protein n=1 Tax=Streptomyces lateritius TaxID=67313 RepID=UPI00167832D9|nr:hypothetical protein [Streptomyces lateritius]
MYKETPQAATAQYRASKFDARIGVDLSPDPGYFGSNASATLVRGVYKTENSLAADTTFSPWQDEWEAPVTFIGTLTLSRDSNTIQKASTGANVLVPDVDFPDRVGEFNYTAPVIRRHDSGRVYHAHKLEIWHDFGKCPSGFYSLTVSGRRTGGYWKHEFEIPQQQLTFAINANPDPNPY